MSFSVHFLRIMMYHIYVLGIKRLLEGSVPMTINGEITKTIFEHDAQTGAPVSRFISSGNAMKYEPTMTKEDEVIIESLEEVWERLE